MTLRLVVSGATGRMGRAIADIAAEAGDIRIAGGLSREGDARTTVGGAEAARSPSSRSAAAPAGAAGPRFPLARPEAAGDLVRGADVVLDVSAPPFLARVLDAQGDALAGRALVVGTTGLDDALARRLEALAEKTAVLVAANFSVGVNLLEALVAEAARRLPAERYDVEIVEAHHGGKADAPSGTALALGRAAAAARGESLDERRRDGRSGRTGARPQGEIGFHAIRGGGVAGEHRVLFLGARERLELAHAATDRTLFAEGAVLAARWIAGREPGRYTMKQVLGLE